MCCLFALQALFHGAVANPPETDLLKLDTLLTMNLKDLLQVEVDPTQMQMVLSALTANAAEAIEGQGLISISAG